ncbi:hypothetical protein [Bacillus smithii]|uniref:hypothetical protein n=1 Tax=Bacillus smithii TaxID=1479 RepID=UPI002E1BB23F|nr:hypothetical protein [Bacillus smithii]MED1456623.1 hypothetical protein [Bacillus smithii]
MESNLESLFSNLVKLTDGLVVDGVIESPNFTDVMKIYALIDCIEKLSKLLNVPTSVQLDNDDN